MNSGIIFKDGMGDVRYFDGRVEKIIAYTDDPEGVIFYTASGKYSYSKRHRRFAMLYSTVSERYITGVVHMEERSLDMTDEIMQINLYKFDF